MHEKISPHHLERKAILYVRQPSAHQVLRNRESGTGLRGCFRRAPAMRCTGRPRKGEGSAYAAVTDQGQERRIGLFLRA